METEKKTDNNKVEEEKFVWGVSQAAFPLSSLFTHGRQKVKKIRGGTQ